MTNKCYLCGSHNHRVIHHGTRDLVHIDVLLCKNCGLVFLSSFDHINKNFYKNSGMHTETVEEWIKSTELDDQRRFMMLANQYCERNSVRMMDFGAGNLNLLTKLHNQFPNWDLWAVEPEERVQPINGTMLKCESLDQIVFSDFDLITMFHTIEHLSDPIEVLSLLRKKLDTNGKLIVETPNVDDALITMYGCKAFEDYTYWGCHLYLFDQDTLRDVAERAGFKSIRINQIQRYPLANHLYWLSNGKPGGHTKWLHMMGNKLNSAYAEQLASIGKCDTLIGEFSK